MARYSVEHKADTRARIVREAGRLFRRLGYEGVGIDTVMAAADLTRGGFYSHFKSKRDLFNAVLTDEHEFIERLKARSGTTVDALRKESIEVAQGYLAPENRRRVAKECSIAALAGDAARGKPANRRAYGSAVQALIGEFSRGLPGEEAEDPRAVQAAALCIGGLILASGCEDKALGDRIANVCAAAVSDALDP